MLKFALALVALTVVAGCCNKPAVQYAAVVPAAVEPAYPAPMPAPAWDSLSVPRTLEK